MRTTASLGGPLSALLGLGLLSAWGAAQEPARRPPTPRDALIQATTALAEGDEDRAFAAILTTTDEQREFLRASMAFNQAGLRFRDAFLKAYGKAAWAKFLDPKQGPKGGHAKLNLLVKDEILAKFKKLTIEEKGDSATGRVPGVPKPFKMKKVEGGWVLPFEGNFSGSFAPKGDNMPKLAEMSKTLREMAATVSKFQKAIGQAGISADDIDVELARAMLRILTGKATTDAPRFDINKIK
jgi:hypothetical protein